MRRSPVAPIRRASATLSSATAASLVGNRLLVWPRTSMTLPSATWKASGTSQKSCAFATTAVRRMSNDAASAATTRALRRRVQRRDIPATSS
jgi:hypothetical protein